MNSDLEGSVEFVLDTDKLYLGGRGCTYFRKALSRVLLRLLIAATRTCRISDEKKVLTYMQSRMWPWH